MEEHYIQLIMDEDGERDAIYVGGKLEVEGDSLDNSDWVDLILEYSHFSDIDTYSIDRDYLEEIAGFPATTEELDWSKVTEL